MVERQPMYCASQLPIKGLQQARTPKPDSALDMTWVPSTGLYKSRTMARAAITTAPSAAPCTVRQAIKASMCGASAQPTAASTYKRMPASKMGRRPQRSDAGPQASCEQPNARIRA